jgi:hypothetical protein
VKSKPCSYQRSDGSPEASRGKSRLPGADPTLYGANWAATGISGVEDRDESAILAAVTVLQGKYDVTW